MATVTRKIRRNIAAKQGKKEGLNRAKFFEWRRQYISQLYLVINNPKSTKKDVKQAKESLTNLRI